MPRAPSAAMTAPAQLQRLVTALHRSHDFWLRRLREVTHGIALRKQM
jgi:hypothetical protein